MQFLSIEAFVPSGANYKGSKAFFMELGFHVNWEVDGYAGLQRDECRFILQRYDVPEFAQNLMFSVKVTDLDAFEKMLIDKQLVEKYGIRKAKIKQQPYGRELNVIDLAGVCWHFVEQ